MTKNINQWIHAKTEAHQKNSWWQEGYQSALNDLKDYLKTEETPQSTFEKMEVKFSTREPVNQITPKRKYRHHKYHRKQDELIKYISNQSRSIKQISKHTGLNPRTVWGRLKVLENKGTIVKISRGLYKTVLSGRIIEHPNRND